MSLSGAISAAVSALSAQSSALAVVATNLANSSTTGYKSSDTSFYNLVTGSGGTASGTGGVAANVVSNASAQGLLTTSSVSTNMGISGSGMFVVAGAAGSNDFYYTRNGEFSVDSEGYLVSNGYYLQGWPTDASGNVVGGTTSSSLTAIDTNAISSVASATASASMIANLPADAEVGDTFTSSFEFYDSLGTAAISTLTCTKTGENEWSASFADPVSAADSSITLGTVSSSSIAITFNEDGTLATTNPDPASLSITGWTTGAADSAITLDMGEAGSSSGLSQYSTASETLSVSLELEQDGMAYGSLTGIDVADDGTVYANYSNGMQLSIYKVALATFPNTDGLSAMSGGIYSASSESGTATYKLSGANGAGTIYGSQLETSTTDTNLEFSRMMAAQQAYSGAAQAMSAANTMFDTLISAVR